MNKKIESAVLVTTTNREGLRPAYYSGTKNGRSYEFIAGYVEIKAGERTQLHDVVFDLETWNTIAQCSCAFSKIVLSGDLVVEDDGYVVHADDPEKRYVRGRLTSPELVDIVDSAGARIAFKRGARLPSAEQLKARAEAEAEDVETGDADDIANA